ncbi:MAG: short-chain dehydrogenase, partial [Bacteroidia bacterium]
MKKFNPNRLAIGLLTLSLVLGACMGCGRELTDEELLARDKANLADRLTSNKVLSYKFCKLILRSASMPGSEDAKTKEFQSIATPIYVKILKVNEGGVQALGVSDYLGLYTDYLSLKDFVIETDEDIYPTIVEALNLSYNTDSAGKQLRYSKEEKLVVQNVEHAALSGLVMLSKDLGRSIALYECAETEPQFLKDGEAKTLLQFYRGFIFFQAGFYYLSQEDLGTNIDWLTAHAKLPLPFMQETFKLDKLNTVKAHIAFRGFNYLMRGFDRLMMDRDIDHERALEDFEHFIADAKEVGLDNELVWVVEAYLYMKREESEKAIVALNKLRASPLLSSKEKDAIDETIGYLNEREPGKALNSVYD